MATLTIPGGLISHVLPAAFHFLSHGRASSTTDLSDTTNRDLVHALDPDGWRLIANIAPMGTPSVPTTYDGGGQSFFVNTMNELWTGATSRGYRKPYFHVGHNAGPTPRQNSSSDMTQWYSSSSTVEGAGGVVAAWVTDMQTRFPGFLKLVEPWNEPTNTSVIEVAGRSWFSPAGSVGGQRATDWANIHIRDYATAIRAVKRPEVLIGHNANGNVQSNNGTAPFQEIVLGKGFVSGFPYTTDNIQAAAYDTVTLHAYAPGGAPFADQMNAMVYPTQSWGTTRHGYLATFDYVRSLLDANGGTGVSLFQSEWEPIRQWGGTGQGVAGDTLLALIGANRQARWNLQGTVAMDVMRDETSLSGGAGDQMLIPSGSGWIKAPRYYGAKDVWGKFLRQYRRIVTVPMYTGDTANCTWTVAPGVTAAGSTTLPVQRLQAVGGYDQSGNFALLVTDINSAGTAEQLTLQLPWNPAAVTVTHCPAGQALNANSSFPAVSFTVANQTFTTGGTSADGKQIYALAAGSSMLIEFALSGGGPPPPPPPPPPTSGVMISTVADNFNDNALDGIWVTVDGSSGNIVAAETNQRQEFACGAGALSTHFSERQSSLTSYDCTGDACWINFVTANGYFQLHQQGSSSLYIGLRVTAAGNLEAYKHISAADVVVGTTVWNATTMAYTRFRESSGTTFWEYASDPTGSWTQLASAASPLTMSQLQIRFGAVGATASTTVVLDNLNTVGINSVDLGPWATAIGVNATQAISPPPPPVDLGEWSTATPVNARIAFSLKTMGNVSRDPSGS